MQGFLYSWGLRNTAPTYIWHSFRWIYWCDDFETNMEFSGRYQGIRFPDSIGSNSCFVSRTFKSNLAGTVLAPAGPQTPQTNGVLEERVERSYEVQPR